MSNDARDLAGRINAINPLDETSLLILDFHVAAVAVPGIGEVDPAFGIDGQVIGRVESLPFVVVREHGNAAVPLGAGHAPVPGLATDQAALKVEQKSVRSRIFAEDAGGSVRVPTPDATTAGEQEIPARMPERAFPCADIAEIGGLCPRSDRLLRGFKEERSQCHDENQTPGREDHA